MIISRKELEQRERDNLAPYASLSAESRGRKYAAEEHGYRTSFQRDRDRVIHTKAFRRLEYKTQVFVYHEGDHYRTRLTHTLEVAQLSRTMARAMRLNEDLAEAIALAHDLGHPPFGHSGESVLDSLMKDHGGFEHNRQSLRVVDYIENRYEGFRGLNLTYEVREGLARHTTDFDSPEELEWGGHQPTLEAQIVNRADEIAYTNHDLDDALSSGLISFPELKGVAIWDSFLKEAQDENPEGGEKLWHPAIVRKIINFLVTDALEMSSGLIAQRGIADISGVRNSRMPLICFSTEVQEEYQALKNFLTGKMYHHYRVLRMAAKAERIIRKLFKAYVSRIEIIPPAVREAMKGETIQKIACDYIAGMTDRFALEEYRRLFDPYTRV